MPRLPSARALLHSKDDDIENGNGSSKRSGLFRNKKSSSSRSSRNNNKSDPVSTYVAMSDSGSRDIRQTASGGSGSAGHRGSLTSRSNSNNLKTNTTDLDDDDNATAATEIYIVRQQYGYCSILFSVLQTLILALMMWQCGVAPLRLNPMIGPYPDALSEWGGKNSVLILEDNEWYRLITPIMLHAGVLHLVGNVAVQLETGVFFEQEWGSLRWLLVYLGSAVGSSCLSVICMPLAVSVGSSGAVMGLFGAKLAEVLLRACDTRKTQQDEIAHQVRKEQCCIVTASVVLVMLFSFIPFVDWAAHLGGLVAGFLVGLMIFAWDIPGRFWKVLWFVVGTAATIAAYALALQYMFSGQVETVEELRDVCGYYQEHFEDYECNCMRDEYLNNGGDNRAFL